MEPENCYPHFNSHLSFLLKEKVDGMWVLLYRVILSTPSFEGLEMSVCMQVQVRSGRFWLGGGCVVVGWVFSC